MKIKPMPKLLPCLVRMLLPAQALCLSAQEVIELNGETGILDESPYYVPHTTSSTENHSFGSPIYQPLEVTHPAFQDDLYLGYWRDSEVYVFPNPTVTVSKYDWRELDWHYYNRHQWLPRVEFDPYVTHAVTDIYQSDDESKLSKQLSMLAIPSSPLLEFNVLTMEAPDTTALPLETTDWSKLFKQNEDMQVLLNANKKLNLKKVE